MQIAERFDKPLRISRILIIQLGDIGDVVWSLPALRTLRATYPDAAVTVLVREGNGSLLTAEATPPGVLEVRTGNNGLWSDLRTSLALVRTLRAQRFNMVFDFRGDERGGYTAYFTGAPVRIARHYPALAWPRNHLFTHLVSHSGDPLPVGAADQSLFLLRAFGIEAESAIPQIILSADVSQRAGEILSTAGVPTAAAKEPGAVPTGSSRWVTVNPFSRWPYKEWQPEKWIAVIDWLGRDFALASVIVGAPSERARANSLAAACSGEVYNLAGKSTLAELAGILGQSRLHIGVDSAAPHIAAAVGTPTVTLYGPSDWRYWAPRGKRHRVVTPDWECAPCHRKGCDGSGLSRCLDGINVATVQATVREALAG